MSQVASPTADVVVIPRDDLSRAVLLYGGPRLPDNRNTVERFGTAKLGEMTSAVKALIAEAMGLVDMTATLYEDLDRIRAEMRKRHPGGLVEAALDDVTNHGGYQTK